MKPKRKEYIHLRGPDGRPQALSLDGLRSRLRRSIQWAWKQGMLAERCGYECVDGAGQPEVDRELADLIDFEGFLKIEPPVEENLGTVEERELLGLHEIIHDLVSMPTEHVFHSFSGCGNHPTSFDQVLGRRGWIDRVNEYLPRFPPGYVMGTDGRVSLVMDEPEAKILDSRLPPGTDPAVADRLERAVARFRKGASTWDEREAALRDIADVLERIRQRVKEHLLKKDEQDLFNLLNNFQIRHFNLQQKGDYDRPIFLTWAFYECLAAIHACERLAERAARGDQKPRGERS